MLDVSVVCVTAVDLSLAADFMLAAALMEVDLFDDWSLAAAAMVALSLAVDLFDDWSSAADSIFQAAAAVATFDREIL